MAIKVTNEMKRAIRSQLARSGGKARAAKYSHEQLSEWAAKGGRPRKNTKEASKKRTPSREKGRRK
jgi:hypothetical protein